MPSIDTLIEDIYGLFNGGDPLTEEDTEALGMRIAKAIQIKLLPRQGSQDKPRLRPSNIGTPNRKLWYDLNQPEDAPPYAYSGPQLLNFLYGDICEELMLWLAERSGHTVEDCQQEQSLGGLTGSMDARIDGHVVDCKSAFAKNYDKFANGTLHGNDPYGYIPQLSFYSQADSGKEFLEHSDVAYFMAFNKHGSLCTMSLGPFDQIDARSRVDECKEIVSQPAPPKEKCYEDVPDGKSGNRKLNTHCARCPWKFQCWEGLREFDYKPRRYLTHVEKMPKVEEIVRDKFDGE